MANNYDIPKEQPSGDLPRDIDASLGYNALWQQRSRFIRFPDAPGNASGAPEIVFPDGRVEPITVDQVKSDLGTPIISPITFKGGTYPYYENGRVEEKDMDDYRLPVTAIVNVSRSKDREKTRLSGGQGTVKEIYGWDDWRINIQGIILDEQNHPQGINDMYDHAAMLKEWDEIADSIEVSSLLLDALDIFRLDIDRIAINEQRGRERVLSFSIGAESDEPVELFNV